MIHPMVYIAFITTTLIGFGTATAILVRQVKETYMFETLKSHGFLPY